MKYSTANDTRYWQIILLGVVYFALALASLRLSFHTSNATPVWPASGLAFAALLAGSPKLAPGIFLGAFSANLYVFIGHHHIAPFTATWVSLLIGLGNTIEALAGYHLLKRFIPDLKISALFRSVHS
jgi:integral membrane sensor domain MASE1